MKARLNRDLVRLLLPLGFSTLLLVVLLCGLAQAIEPEARASFAAPARAANRPSSLAYQTGVPICQQTRNLVPDPGFDQGIGMYTHWHCEGECSFQVDQPGHDSDPSAVIFGQPGEGECRLVTAVGEIYVEPDRWYDYGAWMRTGLLDGDTFLRIRFYKWQDGWAAIHPYAYTNAVTDTGGAWVQVTGSAQSPPDAEYARVEVVLPASSAGSVWVDDVFFGLATCLEINKYDEPDPVSPGEMLTYTIVYSNTGREKATDVQIIETYDSCVYLELVQPPPLVGTTNIWPIPELPPGASGTITVVVRVVEDAEECARILNCVHIRSDETEDLIYTCISTSIVPDGCDIALYLPDKGKSGEPGYPVKYDLVLCNFGHCDGWAYLTATSSLDGDVVIVPSPPYSLPVDSCVQATVSISVPQKALSGTVGVSVITATLACGPPCNETATAAVTLTTTVTAIPLTGVTIDGPRSGYVNTPYTFTATVTPTTATLPIACTWSPTPALGQGCGLVTYIWSTTGPKTITITVTNAAGTVTSPPHRISIEWHKVYLPLVLRRWPPIPELSAIENTDGDGSYVVRWSAVNWDCSYVLEETYVLTVAGNNAFTNAKEVYTGTNSCYSISGRGAARYCYRVKACSGSVCSLWSNVECMDVLWEHEDEWGEGEDDDWNDYNDSRPMANGPLISCKDYYGYPDDKYDFFKIYLATPGQVAMELHGHTGTRVNLHLYSESDPDYECRDTQPPFEKTCGVDKPGWYYIRIRTDKGYNMDTPYTLHVTFP